MTHGQPAWAPDGTKLDRCVGYDEPPPDPGDVLDIDLDETAAFGLWGALAPAISAGRVDDDPGSVHAHVRDSALGAKSVDRSFSIVNVHSGDTTVTINGEDARAWSISSLADLAVSDIPCPRCGRSHTDRDEFAVRPHRKHQCNRCSRDFWVPVPSVGNVLSSAHARLGLPTRVGAVSASARLELRSEELSGLAVWASNPAIIWSGPRRELFGLHVHAWDRAGHQMVDETYGSVLVDGTPLDLRAVRARQVHRNLGHLDGALSHVVCATCGSNRFVEPEPWTASTSHRCVACGVTTSTRRRVVADPLSETEAMLREALR